MHAERHVLSLQLQAPSRALVTRGAFLIEDALRTASLAEPGPGRLIVRRLSLGSIDPASSPTAVSRHLERRFARLASSAVRFDAPSAGRSEAVRFGDAEQAYLVAGERLARRVPVDEWFWPLAAPPFRVSLSRGAAARTLLQGLLATPAGAVAGARLLHVMVQAGDGGPLLETLSAEDGAELLAGLWRQAAPQRSGETPQSPAPITPSVASTTERDVISAVAGKARDGVLPWLERWGLPDDRACWVVAALRIAEEPRRLADPTLLESVRGELHALLNDRYHRPTRRAHQAPERDLRAPREPQRSQPGSDAVEGPEGDGGDRSGAKASALRPGKKWRIQVEREPIPGEGKSPAPTRSREEVRGPRLSKDPGAGDATAILEAPEIQAPRDPRLAEDATPAPSAALNFWPTEGLRSEYAGLFFLVRPLAHLGIAERLAEKPEWARHHLPAAVLDRAAEELGAAAEDPARLALDLGSLPELAGWQPEIAAWLERLGNFLKPMIPSEIASEIQAEPGEPWRDILAPIVRRTGRLLLTRSHLDIVFDHRQADLWIRRSGLDIDPGWMAFFGRVITFHYRYREHMP